MKTFRFLDFPVYQKAKQLYIELLSEVKKTNNFALRDQTSRAALSVVLNIAEGSARNSDREMNYHVRVALGSINEVAACLEIMKTIEIIDQTVFGGYLTRCEDIAKQLGGLSRALRSKS